MSISVGLDFFEVVLEVEEEFDIKIPDTDWPAMVTVGELYDAAIDTIRIQYPERFSADPAYADKVWEQLKTLLVVQLALKPHQIVRSARFYYELGLQ